MIIFVCCCFCKKNINHLQCTYATSPSANDVSCPKYPLKIKAKKFETNTIEMDHFSILSHTYRYQEEIQTFVVGQNLFHHEDYSTEQQQQQLLVSFDDKLKISRHLSKLLLQTLFTRNTSTSYMYL